MKNKKRKIFGLTATTLMFLGVVVGILVLPSLLEPIAPDYFRQWRPIRASDAAPGAGECGVINVFIYPHQADGSAYDVNLTEGSAYAHFDGTPSLNESLEGDVPYDTTFDIVVWCQFNYTVAYNTSSADWDLEYVKGLITCADLSIGADTEMSESSDFIWTTGNSLGDTGTINFFINNTGSGYTRTHGVTTNVTDFSMQGYW